MDRTNAPRGEEEEEEEAEEAEEKKDTKGKEASVPVEGSKVWDRRAQETG